MTDALVTEYIRRFSERCQPGEEREELFYNGCVLILRPSISRAMHVEICSIRAKAVRVGHGTITMLALCDLADEMGVALELAPTPFGASAFMDQRGLKRWYWTFGFTDLYRPTMVRFPKPEDVP